MTKNNQFREIENRAREYFKKLDIGTPAFILGPTISFFEFSLDKHGIFYDDENITHSKKLLIPINAYTDIRTLAIKIAYIYGTKHVDLINYKKKDHYISFVGYENETHACYVSLKKLYALARKVRKAFIEAQK